jgi:hypothetical protein
MKSFKMGLDFNKYPAKMKTSMSVILVPVTWGVIIMIGGANLQESLERLVI